MAMAALARVLLVATLGLTSFSIVRWDQRAQLRPEQDLPADVEAEVDATWARFLDVFASRQRCFDDVSLRLVTDLDRGDARYVIDEVRIEIAIPTSPRRFRESLVHELAHHVEHTCPAFGSLRRDLGALPAFAAVWTAGERWQDVPSELWAETAVEVVNGERVRHGRGMPLPAGAADLVAAWARSG
jgi:hypothetical protein